MRGLTLIAVLSLVSCEGTVMSGSTPNGLPPGVVDPAVAAGCEAQTFQLTRLNRREIDESLKQLWGDTVQPARLFGADTIRAEVFDNDSDGLSIAPRLIQDLEAAAPKVIDDVWARDAALLSQGSGGTNTGAGGYSQSLPGTSAQATVGGTRDGAWNLWSNGEAKFQFNVPSAGTYAVTVTAYQDAAGSEPARMDVWVNGAMQQSFQVMSARATPSQHVVMAPFTAGAASVGIRFTNDINENGMDRNLLIVSVKVEGAGSPSAPPSTTQKPFVRVCSEQTDACAATIIGGFARQAWRRPASADEQSELMALFQATKADGDDFDTSLKLALRSVLLSPHFLIRAEAVMPEKGPRSAVALASRLAFFLWSGPPDAELSARADDETLFDEAVLDAQVTRMLQHPRAKSLQTQLVGQWFQSQSVAGFSLDPGLFPGVNQQVMNGVQQQMDSFVGEYFFGDHDALDALDAPVTYLDNSLAQFLSLPQPGGSGVMRVALDPSSSRAGLLGQSAPLIVTSKSTETDPPRRGKYVIERLLCQSMPLPTGIDIPPVPPATAQQPTARDRLEALTSPQACQGCHARLNPIGFSLENFSADSRFRSQDHGATIDPRGELDGAPVDGLPSLARVLKADPRVEACMVEKTLSYAIARPVSGGDREAVKQLQAKFVAGQRRYLGLIAEVAKSPLVVEGCRPR